MSSTAQPQGNSQGSSHSDSSPSRSSGSLGGGQERLGDVRRLRNTTDYYAYLGRQLEMWFGEGDDIPVSAEAYSFLARMAEKFYPPEDVSHDG